MEYTWIPQSGIKNFRFADPIHHKDLFLLAEEEIKKNDQLKNKNLKNLLKLYDRAEVVSEVVD